MKSKIKLWFGQSLWGDVKGLLNASQGVFCGFANRFGFRRRLRSVCGTDLLLHLGCGPRIQDGWVNVDQFSFKGAYFADLRDPLELTAGAIRHIHCEHMLEHLDREEASRFLGECRRVLAPNGTMRLILPDAEKYLRAYAGEDEAFFFQLRHLGNAVNPLRHPITIINQMFRMGGGHRYAWDFTELTAALTEAGFENIQRSRFGDVETEYQIDGPDEWRRHESIYLNVFGKKIAAEVA